MAHLYLKLLGPFHATLDGAPLEGLRYDKARALLSYLAMEAARPHPREKLAGLLWPDHPESAARQNLNQALFVLRRALREPEAAVPFLLSAPDRVQWNPASDAAVDARELAALVAACQAHEHVRQEACAECLPRLEQAAALYEGPFLEGFSLADAPEFEEWCSLQRERAQRLAVQALAGLAEARCQRREYTQALEAARRAEALDPWQEETQRQLMTLLAESGDRNAALAQYERCREALQRELGVEPAAETTALCERIREGQVGSPPGPQGAEQLSSLPASLFPLVGRAEELARLSACLRDPDCRLLTILGPGGVGKTRLAVEVCGIASDAFQHGIGFVPLSAVSADGLLSAIAGALGFAFYAGAGVPPREQLLAYLRRKRTLLVLDGCEHLLDGMALVGEILATAPGVKVLATSRARLNLPGEQLFPLEGLALTPAPSPKALGEGNRAAFHAASVSDALEGRGEAPAVALFIAAAQRARPGYAPTDADAPAVAAICQRVEGLPLALLLAATWMHLLSPPEIAAQLQEDSGRGLDLLAADWQGVPEPERSMRATLDRSWSLLGEREQAILAGLAVFRGGFTAEAAEAVTGATLRDLARLADRSLIYRRESGRYDLHDLLREYAAAKLAATADSGERARERAASYLARCLAAWQQEIFGPGQPEALDRIERELGNVVACWEWALARERADWLAVAAESVGRHEILRQPIHGVSWTATATALREWIGRKRGQEPAAWLDEARALGRVAFWVRWLFALPLEPTRELLAESLALLEEQERGGQEVRLEKAQVLLALGHASTFDQTARRRWLVPALELFSALGQRAYAAKASRYIGIGYRIERDLAQARKAHDQELALIRQVGDPNGLGTALDESALLALYEGDAGRAEREAREAWALNWGRGRNYRLTFSQSLGFALWAVGKYEEALAWAEGMIPTWEREMPATAYLPHLHGAIALMHLGRYAEARTRLEGISQRFNSFAYGTDIVLYLGFVAIAKGRYAEAANRGQEAEERRQGGQAGAGRGWVASLLLGLAERRLGRREEAREHLITAACYSWRARMSYYFAPWPVSDAPLPWAALLLRDQGRVELALELRALALQRPWFANSRWFHDVFWEPIVAAAATLSPEVVAAAEERGRQRDAAATVRELIAELEGETGS